MKKTRKATVWYLSPEIIASSALLTCQSLTSHFVKNFYIEHLIWSPQSPYSRQGFSSLIDKEVGDQKG